MLIIKNKANPWKRRKNQLKSSKCCTWCAFKQVCSLSFRTVTIYCLTSSSKIWSCRQRMLARQWEVMFSDTVNITRLDVSKLRLRIATVFMISSILLLHLFRLGADIILTCLCYKIAQISKEIVVLLTQLCKHVYFVPCTNVYEYVGGLCYSINYWILLTQQNKPLII